MTVEAANCDADRALATPLGLQSHPPRHTALFGNGFEVRGTAKIGPDAKLGVNGERSSQGCGKVTKWEFERNPRRRQVLYQWYCTPHGRLPIGTKELCRQCRYLGPVALSNGKWKLSWGPVRG